MTFRRPSRSVARLVTLVLLVSAVAAGVTSATGSGQNRAVAYFAQVSGIYPHDKVKILGITVGEIEEITPEADRVRVEFSYDADHRLPADVRAAIVSPTLVATRHLQLAPAYTDGPVLADGAEIPEERTAAPLEFDDLKAELSRISEELGPQGEGDSGALADFLSVSARAGKGRGAQFNVMVTELSAALRTLSEGRGDIFGTVRNLQVFISAMAALDQNIVVFNRRLAGVADLLDDNGPALDRALSSVDTAARLLDRFLAENRPALGRSTRKLTTLTTMLAESRDDLATALHIGPNTLTNFSNIYSSRINAYTGGLAVGNLGMGQIVCALVANQLAQAGRANRSCVDYLGPLLDQVQVDDLPVGVGPPIKQPQPEQREDDPGLDEDAGPVDGLLGLLKGDS